MTNLVKNEKDLLACYVKDRNQEAFAGLVEHYQGLVFAAARRQVHDASLAEDVSQAVFLLLASKARSVKPAALTAWLLQTTRLSALAMLRQEAHQRHCDQQAVEEPTAAVSDSSWMELQPHLDEALCALPEKDRAALLMRFFEEMPDQAIGERLGVSGNAATQRINRALDKLQRLFKKRGLHLSGAALTGLLSTKLVEAAPMSLTPGILQAHAVAASGGLFAGGLGAVFGTSSVGSLGPSVSSQVLPLFLGVKKMMFVSALKYGLAVALIAGGSLGGTAALVASQQEAPAKTTEQGASSHIPVAMAAEWLAEADAYLKKYLQVKIAAEREKGHDLSWTQVNCTDSSAYATFFPDYLSYNINGKETYRHDGKELENSVWEQLLVHRSGKVMDIVKQDQCLGVSLLQPAAASPIFKVTNADDASKLATAYLALMMKPSTAAPEVKLEYAIVEACAQCGDAGKVEDWEAWKAAGGAKGGGIPTKLCSACQGKGENKRPLPSDRNLKGTWVVTYAKGVVRIQVTDADSPLSVQGNWKSSRRRQ